MSVDFGTADPALCWEAATFWPWIDQSPVFLQSAKLARYKLRAVWTFLSQEGGFNLICLANLTIFMQGLSNGRIKSNMAETVFQPFAHERFRSGQQTDSFIFRTIQNITA